MSMAVGGSSGGGDAAIVTAKAALARANGTVDADRRAHSPGCVAVDQKIADRASAALAALRPVRQVATAGAGTGLSILA